MNIPAHIESENKTEREYLSGWMISEGQPDMPDILKYDIMEESTVEADLTKTSKSTSKAATWRSSKSESCIEATDS